MIPKKAGGKIISRRQRISGILLVNFTKSSASNSFEHKSAKNWLSSISKDQAELREAPRPREGSFRAKPSLPPRQSAHGMTSATPTPSSHIKQSIKLHQAKEAPGLAISAIKRTPARRTSPWAVPRTSAAPTTAQLGRWLFSFSDAAPCRGPRPWTRPLSSILSPPPQIPSSLQISSIAAARSHPGASRCRQELRLVSLFFPERGIGAGRPESSPSSSSSSAPTDAAEVDCRRPRPPPSPTSSRTRRG